MCRVICGTSKPRSPVTSEKPRRPTIGNVSWVVAATQIGGCGFWNGFGTTPRSLIEKYFPSCVNRSCVQALTMTSSDSWNRSRLSSYGTP
jgi:hypothetical protein